MQIYETFAYMYSGIFVFSLLLMSLLFILRETLSILLNYDFCLWKTPG
jgi:uncharacterized integral membrane protein